MRIGTMALGGFTLAACSGGSFNQGNDIYSTGDDTAATTAEDDTGTGGSGTGGEGTGGEGTGSGDDGSTTPTACANTWMPADVDGWTKDFSGTYNGNEATITERGMGAVSGEDGVYLYRDSVSAPGLFGDEGWDLVHTVHCDPEGEEGMYLAGYAGTKTYLLEWGGFEIGIPVEVDAVADPAPMVLPPEYAVGATGTWDYAYTLTMTVQMDTGQPQDQTFDASGTYAELGEDELELFDGTTVTALKLSHTYAITGEWANENGYAEQWFVAGLGVVKETITNTDDDTEVMSKELTGYAGLTVAE